MTLKTRRCAVGGTSPDLVGDQLSPIMNRLLGTIGRLSGSRFAAMRAPSADGTASNHQAALICGIDLGAERDTPDLGDRCGVGLRLGWNTSPGLASTTRSAARD
ncbi:MAG: hypothetical protein H0V41_04865 [Pseudonocardiales bacterium]|nr:hypothetical protein [Pseudonocardiales bacterium]